MAILSVLYGSAVRVRNRAFDTAWMTAHHAAVPVVSVGNITTGGTGKTPFVAWLVRWFGERGLRVAILSRGYRSLDGAANDEKRVLDQLCPNVPHLQHPDRVASAARAVREHDAQVLILDDGFQHRRLARDLDIVLVDALNPWGYGRLLPRGLLREPLSSLRRASLIAITRADQCPPEARARIRAEIAETGTAAPVVEVAYPPVRLINAAGESSPLETLSGRTIAAFCGIGNPSAFKQSLTGLGTRVAAFSQFPDHHRYTAADLDAIARAAAQSGAEVVVTTQKDLVKLQQTALNGRPVWAVEIGLRVLEGGTILQQAVERIVSEDAKCDV